MDSRVLTLALLETLTLQDTYDDWWELRDYDSVLASFKEYHRHMAKVQEEVTGE